MKKGTMGNLSRILKESKPNEFNQNFKLIWESGNSLKQRLCPTCNGLSGSQYKYQNKVCCFYCANMAIRTGKFEVLK